MGMSLGLNRGLALNNTGGAGGFSPLSLFSAGEVGAWYDPSDLTTLFQDAAGTTPVTAAGQSVGLVLDKSRELTLGPELVSNGGLTTNTTGWTAGAGASIARTTNIFADGGLRVTANGMNESFSTQVVSGLTVGRRYVLSASVYSPSSNATNDRATIGVQEFDFTTAGSRSQTSLDTVETISISFVAGATTQTIYMSVVASNFVVWGTPGSIGVFDNISVKELLGNHASQSSSTFRSVYQTGPARQVYDGSDDRDVSTLVPTTAGTLAARFNGTTASRVALGSQGATDGRCFLALASDGSVGAGIGTQTTATIKGTNDVRNAWTTGVVTWDGSNVFLYENGVQVYTGAQSGAVNTTVAMMRGCLNNNGVAASFWAGSISPTIALNRALTAAEVLNLHNRWSVIQ